MMIATYDCECDPVLTICDWCIEQMLKEEEE